MTRDPRYPAGVANYRGDFRSIIGQIKGPTTYGGHVMAVAAQYDEATDRTKVAMVHATPEDIAKCVPNGDGVLRLPTLDELNSATTP